MSGASVETTLELWASCLRDVKARMRPLFGGVRMAVAATICSLGMIYARDSPVVLSASAA